MRRSYIKGFTLAEVLITLTIIGVIAALVIPALVQDVQDTQFKTAYRKALSVANQAITKAYNDNQLSAMTTMDDPTNMSINFIAFKNQFVVSKYCPNDAYNCWNSSGEYLITPGVCPSASTSAFIDNSGMEWVRYCDGNGEAMISVDTNGNNGPNHYGKDRWFFKWIDINGSRSSGIPIRVVPYDPSDETTNSWNCHYPPCYFSKWLK